MKQELKSIHEFVPGDIVTRVQPSAIINNHMFIGELSYDSRYIGEKLIFVGIANGCAYFESCDSFTNILEKGKLIDLPIHKFEDGWAHYIDPTTLINTRKKSKYESMSESLLINNLNESIEKEDYEEASRLKHEIDKRGL